MPLIRDYVAEHERALDLGDTALRAIDRGDLDEATRLVADLHVELTRHWVGEENGIFRVMAAHEQQFADYVAPLVAEHRELASLLDRLDLVAVPDQEALRVAMAELKEHISREEDGLFPASVIALDGEDWDASMGAWQVAHPGETMISD